MAKTIAPVAVSFVESKSSLKSVNVQVNEVPTNFAVLQQNPGAATPPLTNGVRLVTAAEYKEAALCLAEAFAEDDVARYFIDVPDREHWTEQEKWDLHVEILEYVTYAHILKGLVTTVGDDYDAVALWLPPGQNMDDFWTMLRSGMWRLNYRLSPEGKRRFFTEFLPLLHDTMHGTLGDRDAESWYLVYLGTKPSGRGKGYARKLITHVTQQADREGRPVYLESSNEVNPPIYRKFGFETRRTVHLQRAERNVSLDIMVREPVAQEKAAAAN
ncbi:hypothetical protein BS50DRAFT_503411 [Corynespora cassiicola Philippines]|uniref:N-acetyltransferase domain-containing protein n=1 Tax=Corynespora cassiicola Philippines TaxID=1448308 RepID=A0A2T2NA02_CORCC|nr:hypothetical protein BS50DRAFT_503411 [Corynespora cassiicola Philippines]